MSVLIKETERYIANCEFSLRSNLGTFFHFDIKEFAKFILNNYWKETYFRNHRKSSYRILRAKLVEECYLVIYMQYSNGEAANPAFANLNNGKSRIIKKNDDEGVACSAHLVIDITPTDMPNKFNAVLEDMQGLTRTMVCNLINYISRNYKVQDPNESNKSHKPIANLEFFAKNNFEKQLRDGKIESIVAYQESFKQSSEMDLDGTIQYKEVHRLEFAKPSILTNPIKYLAATARIAKNEGFYGLKVTHKDNNKEQSGKYKLPTDEMDPEQLYEDIRLAPFISKQCIILDKPRGICNHTWSSHLIRAMIDAF